MRVINLACSDDSEVNYDMAVGPGLSSLNKEDLTKLASQVVGESIEEYNLWASEESSEDKGPWVDFVEPALVRAGFESVTTVAYINYDENVEVEES